MPSPSALSIEFLQNYDIVCEVLEYVGEAQDGLRANASLVAVALTCKALSEPALDVLWRNLTNFAPLLKLLPSLTKIPNWPDLYTLVGPLTSTEFVRFDHNAARVRSMRFTHHAVPLDPSVFMLIAKLHSGPMLPRLQKLSIFNTYGLGGSIILLSSPTLRSVELVASPGYGDGATFPMFLSHTTPDALEELTLKGEFPTMTLDFIPRFTNLRHLAILEPAYSTPLQRIATALVGMSAQTISSLVLHLPEELDASVVLNLPGDAFAALNQLEILGEFDIIHQFLAGVKTAQLRRIVLDFKFGPYSPFDQTGDWRTNHWRSLFDLLVHQWRSSLEQLSIKFDDPGSGGFADLFPGLYSVPHLCELRLTVRPRLNMSDDAVAALAAACPRLEILELDIIVRHPLDEDVSLPSASSLIHIAKHCPRLVQLNISLDLTIEFGTETCPVPVHRLRELTLYHKLIRFEDLGVPKIHSVAQFLDTLFPNLESMNGVGQEGADICTEIQGLQGARAEQRRGLRPSG